MRSRLIVAASLVTAAACSKSSPSGSSPASANQLWSLAPAGAQVGVVITPRGMQMLEGAAVALQEVAKRPEMAPVIAEFDEPMKKLLGGDFAGLATLGLDRNRGLGLWQTADGGTVVALPLADRAKLRAFVGEPFDKLTCKARGGFELCATDAAVLDGLGKTPRPAALDDVGTRGDIELVVGTAAAMVAQLERGTVVVRGTTELPAQFATVAGAAQRPRTDATTAGFLVAGIDKMLGSMPADAPLAPGLTIGDLAGALAGPLTITIAAGTTVPDLRVPFRDPAPVTALVSHCDELVPAELRIAGAPGECRFRFPDLPTLELELWLDGKDLRVGHRTAPAGKPVEMTALGKELAGGSWNLAFWGRGTVFASSDMPMLPPNLPASFGPLVRLMTSVNEVGVGARVEDGKAHFVIGVRTMWVNPPAVVTGLLAIPPQEALSGSSPAAAAVAGKAPSSPFARDFAAGAGGLMVPSAVMGMLAAVAIPAFMDYQQRAAAVPY